MKLITLNLNHLVPSVSYHRHVRIFYNIVVDYNIVCCNSVIYYYNTYYTIAVQDEPSSKCNLEINFVNNKYCDSKHADDTRIGGYNL